ncbi:FxDxF family PEP-CTERM protein [Actimicrobium sp. CCI2.3]|uniref:FxDxF family PEP-CTERM protein n=1 Tax=Actimicrobium sp. CCI2.3 TaxID=3048616 RepID=UPI002AB4D011|nr:FxDxF family PEP-CTERM protein [Actimicrobium sp. CCI2.3]MDY7575671.1 FxDxF family PEP-CTERM protein [Actimicrobium sp. CCI2.3]MEB0021958.1 FxDxF family PEP-CTERM protein [Actimicrobium sp. CCI2.3]
MKFNYVLAVIALSSVTGFSNAAKISTANTQSFNFTLDASDPDFLYTQTQSVVHLTGKSFLDNFSFALVGQENALGSSATNQRPVLGFYVNPGSIFDINSMVVSLYKGVLNTGVLLGSSPIPGANIASYGQELLTAGDYYFTVAGKTTGSGSSGSYLFTVDAPMGQAIPSPVPEPETYAMMLAGLGLLGFAARRKSKGNQV